MHDKLKEIRIEVELNKGKIVKSEPELTPKELKLFIAGSKYVLFREKTYELVDDIARMADCYHGQRLIEEPRRSLTYKISDRK